MVENKADVKNVFGYNAVGSNVVEGNVVGYNAVESNAVENIEVENNVVKNKKYTVAIDLGESNVVVVVGSKDSRGMVTIDGVVSRPCEGVKCGMIENIALVEESIRAAVAQIEEYLNIRIIESYVGISGEFVRFACHTDHVYVTQPHNGVSQGDVVALFERMSHVQAPENETIMERLPQNYVVDEAKEVKNPVGSFGRRLSSTFNFVLCGNTPMQRLENALRKAGIKMLRAFPNALSVAESVLTSDEKEEGVALVNIGGGLTDVTIYYRNVVRYIVSIPMGANSINHDIRSMMIPDKYIEKLKCEYGSAVADLVPENKAVRVPGRTPRDSRNVMLYNLAVAIEARMAMLINFVRGEIQDSGYADKLPYGVVITGGSAQLANIDELFRRMMDDVEVRIGVPVDGIAEESLDIIDSPEYATAVGILLRGMSIGSCVTGDNTPVNTNVVAEPAPSKEPVASDLPKDTPPKVGKSEPYTPPTPRQYTPPTAVEPSREVVQPPVYPPVNKEEEEAKGDERVYEDVDLDEKVSSSTLSSSSEKERRRVEYTKPRKNLSFADMMKRALDKLNDGFSVASGDEEI